MKKSILNILAAVTVGLLVLFGGLGIGYGIGWKHALMAVANSEIRGRR